MNHHEVEGDDDHRRSRLNRKQLMDRTPSSSRKSKRDAKGVSAKMANQIYKLIEVAATRQLDLRRLQVTLLLVTLWIVSNFWMIWIWSGRWKRLICFLQLIYSEKRTIEWCSWHSKGPMWAWSSCNACLLQNILWGDVWWWSLQHYFLSYNFDVFIVHIY